MTALMVTLGTGVAALLFAFVRSRWILAQDEGTDKMKEIGAAIREGAMAFLGREYRVLGLFVVVVASLLAVVSRGSSDTHWMVAVSFVAGAVCSGLAGYFGMRVATSANYRTAAAARVGLVKALGVSFAGGSVMGMCVVGLAILGLTSLYIFFKAEFVGDITRALSVLSGFSLGASSIALFARVGGGIYTKAADVGADIVGKIEAGIPEDDPRNPATIADNVGDNVGDVAGMGADLFESYIGAIVGSMILGATLALGWHEIAAAKGFDASKQDMFLSLVELPLFLAALGILASIVGTYFVRTSEDGNPQTALHIGTFAAAGIMLIGAWFLIGYYVPDGAMFVFPKGQLDASIVASAADAGPGIRSFGAALGIFLATVLGLVSGSAIGLVTEYYTSDHRAPVHSIAKQAETGPATVIIAGVSVGMISTLIPTLLIAATIVASFQFAGLYGIAIAALGMLSTTGIQLAVDAYGPIADNAGGIAEMSELPKEVRERTDRLDAVGNTTAAIGKGFAIGSAALTALALFASFATKVNLDNINVLKPEIMAGVFIGGMLPFLFSSFAMAAVGRAAFSMIEEVRRQFREIPGLREGNAKAEYAKCVDIATASAIREMVMPGLIAVISPVVVGLWSIEALGGLLVGTTVTGVLLALFMANAGGAWDNAKKYIEGGKHGGKGSDAHKAAVVGDTVGDPFKDTAGPSLNILIKLMSVVAVVTAPALVAFHASKPGDAKKPATEVQPPPAHVRTVAAPEADSARPAALLVLKSVDDKDALD